MLPGKNSIKEVSVQIFVDRTAEMLQINVAQQLKAAAGTVREYSIEDEADVIEGDGKTPVGGSVTLLRTDRGILARGTLHTDVELTCSRCLSVFTHSLSVGIEEEYLPTIDVYTGSTLSLPEDTDTFTIDENNILDLTEALRQYALTAIPMKPLCQPDCAGLCPVCGGNLNQGACRCSTKPPDARWAKLVPLILAGNETLAKDQKGKK